MKMPFSLSLALRFLKSKRYGALARFISIASTTGICVGVCALIIGLSAMNGFEAELSNRVLSLVPSAEITSVDEKGFEHLSDDLRAIRDNEHVVAASEVITINGAFSFGTSFAPAMILGINTETQKDVTALERFMDCKTQALDNKEPMVILGKGIASKLHLKAGDTVSLSLVSMQGTADGLNQMVQKQLKVAGFFSTGGQIDSNLAFISIDYAKTLAALDEPNTIHIRVDDMMKAPDLVYEAARGIKDRGYIKTWFDTQGKLYHDINMVRGIMYLAMILVIAVACFNIVSNLIMAVSEKRHEIAVLLTMGASRSLIRRTFTLMGILSAAKGAMLGVVIGCLLSSVTPYITSHFEQWFGFELLNHDIYFINYVPSVLKFEDVIAVVLCALLMSAIASLYPAFRASRVNPSSELNI